MNPAKLFQLLARFPEHAENLALERELVNPARKTIRAIQNLVRRRRDANRPGCPRRHRLIPDDWHLRFLANRWASIAIDWHINDDLAQDFSLAVEHLNAAVATIRNVHSALRINRDAMWSIELPGFTARLTPGLNPVALFVDFCDARIDVAVADVGVARRIPCHVGNLSEHSIHWRQRRLGMFQRLRALVRGFLLAAKNHNHAALGVELDDHVRAFVGDPDVVILVDFYRVRERPGVKIVANLSYEFPVPAKLQELRGACPIGRTN